MKKTLATILTLALSLSLFAIPVFAAEASGRIEPYEMNGTQAFAYIPDGLEGGRRGAGRGANTAVQQVAPIILVYGNEPFTAESALQTAYDSGLAEIAAQEGAVISFVNPKNGTSWSAEDVGTYSSIVQNKYVERPAQSLEPTNGIYPNETHGGQFAGFFYRTVIVAEGSGANFAAQYLMDDTLVDSRNIQTIPASYILFNATATPGDKAGSVNQQYPAVVVNGSQALETAITALNGKGYTMFEESGAAGLDKAVLTKGYKELAGLMVRPQMSYSPLPNHYIGLFQLTNNLVLDDLFDHGYTSKDVGGGTAYYDYYIPKNIDRSQQGAVPLVMVFHGSGESSEYIAKMAGWTRLAQEEGFMVVSVDNHGSADIQIALLDALLAEYPFLDASRVYATGFSMGSMKTWSMIANEEHAKKLAAISPWSAMTAPGNAQTSVMVPTMYTHGQWDSITGFPTSETSTAADRLRQVFAMNNAGEFAFDAEADPYWRVKADKLEIIRANCWDGEIRIHSFESDDGVVYTRLVDATNFGHSISGDFAPLAWDFMKQFSRNADGTIEVASSLELAIDNRLVSSGDYFSATASLAPAANSNAATITFNYDPSKFVYHKFDAAEGVTVLATSHDADSGTLTLTLGKMDGYGLGEVGAALFQARTDAKLVNEKVTITAGMDYVLLKDDVKTIKSVGASAKVGTIGMLGDTNNDGVVDIIDLSNMIDWFGVTSRDAEWEQAEFFDFNYNDEIEISDIAKVASLIQV